MFYNFSPQIVVSYSHIIIIVFKQIIIFDKVKKGPLISPGGVQSSHESQYISGDQRLRLRINTGEPVAFISALSS